MSSRLCARLEHLSHEELIALIDDLTSWIPDAVQMTEEYLHTHSPFPEWARDNVLRNVDLLPCVMKTLHAIDWPAAAVHDA